MIGEIVTFSINKQIVGKGEVVDQISMLNSTDKHGAEAVVTGYMIRTGDGKVYPVQYWRILTILD